MTPAARLALLAAPCFLAPPLASAAPRARRAAAPTERPASLAAAANPTPAPTRAGVVPEPVGVPVAPPAGEAAPVAVERELDWLSETPVAPAAPAGRGVAGFLLALLGAAGAAAGGAAWQRRYRRAPAAAEREQIALLATRALGGKQRLALVQVCGERLLLASCDGELSLISHLPGGAEGQTEAEDAVADNGAEAAPAAPPVPPVAAAPTAPTPAARPVEAPQAPGFAAALAHHAPPRVPAAAASVPDAPAAEPFSADLAGLRAWRAHGAAEVRA